MRIALVAEDYYPQLGGVPEHVHNLTLQLARRGHQVTVITSRMRGDRPDPPFVRRVGTSVPIYANGGSARLTVGRQLTRRLAALFRDNFDVIHVQGGLAPTFGLLAPRAAFRVGIPVVATFHSWFATSPSYRVVRRPLQHILSRHAATIAVSDAAVEAMSRYFKANWEVIPNGVDLECFHPHGRRNFAAGADGPRLLFLHRLEPRNHLGTVLDAMPAVLRRYPDTQLVVAGDGPLRGYYQRRAAQLGPHVTFVGSVRGPERPEHYRAADLYLCPTMLGSFGITLLEAMACGTPAIVADGPGFRALVKAGAAAMLLPYEDPVAWAEAIIALTADPGRRQAMSAAGLANVRSYAWPVVADRVLEVYRRVVQPSREGQLHANAGSRTRTPCGTGS